MSTRLLILTVCTAAMVSALLFGIVERSPWFAVVNLSVGYLVALAWALAPRTTGDAGTGGAR